MNTRANPPGRLAAEPRWGPYEIVGLVGEGGMARVYAARHRDTGERRALKVVSLSSPTIAERFAREARLQGRVRHENVLPVLDVLQTDEGLVLVLPLVEGPNLSAALRQASPGPADAMAMFGAIVAGVAAIHAAGLVHRDLKPANVLLDPTGSTLGVRVADFGLVKPVVGGDDLTRPGMAMGTRGYMSPEQQADARSAGAPADVWALGCILHELGTGRRYVDRPTAELPAELAAWSELKAAMLRPDPRERIADAGRVLARLPSRRAASAAWLDECRRMTATVARDRPAAEASSTPVDRSRVGNLPAERDRFVGRTKPLGALQAHRRAGARLMTLVGPAGSGKTRLAVRFGHGTVEAVPGGVWFCDVAQVRTISGLCAALALTLGVHANGRDAVAALGHAIAARGACLIVLDAFDALVLLGPDTLARWIARCPEACFLVTSRQRTRLAGEVLIPVDPLPTDEAVELFTLRAAAGDGPTMEASDLNALAQLVERLDCLPLAIELVASQAGATTPQALLARLNSRRGLTPVGDGPTEPLSALRATLDVAWDFLSSAERKALRQLSVFEGGFTLRSADGVLALGHARCDEAVQSLVEQSWARQVAEGRWAMLATLREYAAGRLDDDGATARRYARWFADLARPMTSLGVGDPTASARVRELRAEVENLFAAGRVALGAGDADGLGHLVKAVSLLTGWNRSKDVATLATGLLALRELSTEQRFFGALALSGALRTLGNAPEALRHAQDALAAAEELGDDPLASRAHAALAEVTQRLGPVELEVGHAEKALELSRGPDQRVDRLPIVTTAMIKACRWERARELATELLALARDLRSPHHEAFALGSLALIVKARSPSEAIPGMQQALRLQSTLDDRWAEGRWLSNLAACYAESGQLDEAIALMRRGIRLYQELGDQGQEGLLLTNLGCVLSIKGNCQEASELLERAAALREEAGDAFGAMRARTHLGTTYLKLGRRADAEPLFERGLAEHARLGDPAFLAKALQKLAELDMADGALSQAVARLERAVVVAEEAGLPLVAGDVQLVLARVVIAQGDLTAAEAWLDRAQARLGASGNPQEVVPVRALRERLVALRAATDPADRPPRPHPAESGATGRAAEGPSGAPRGRAGGPRGDPRGG